MSGGVDMAGGELGNLLYHRFFVDAADSTCVISRVHRVVALDYRFDLRSLAFAIVILTKRSRPGG